MPWPPARPVRSGSGGDAGAVPGHHVHVPPDLPDDRGDGAARPGGPDDALSFVVPDDARALFRDVEALRRERRAAARRDRLARVFLTRRWRRFGLSGPLVVAALLVVALPGMLLTVLRPGFPARARTATLSAPAAAPGEVGGLLPDIALSTPVGPRPARGMRPAVLVLVPTPCDCDDAVSTVVDQALVVTHAVRLVSAGTTDTDGRAVEALASGSARGLVATAVDPTGALTAAYRATGVTVLVVAPDGVVLSVTRDVRPGRRLTEQVGRLQPA